MSKNKKLEVVTLRLHEGDVDFIKRFFPDHAYNLIIRAKIHQFVLALQEKERQILNEEDSADATIDLAGVTSIDGED